MQVIPAINATTFEKAREQIEIAVGFLPPADAWIHLDIVDGKFAPNITWGKADDLRIISNFQFPISNLKLEVHLMVERPELTIEAWLENGVKRIIVHVEALNDPLFILNTCSKYNAQAGLSINPDTPVEKLIPYLANFKFVQILAVKPGLAGQKFDGKVLGKIKFLRKNHPDVTIEIDGGINPETAKLAKRAGADIGVSASYIFGSKEPRKAYQVLSSI